MPDSLPASGLPRPDDAPASPAADFRSLGLAEALCQAAAAAGWRAPTPVQAAVIPPVLQGRDLLVQAPTGAGKTASFLLPLLQRVLAISDVAALRPRQLTALVLAPTRELAAQIGAAAQALAPMLKTEVLVGGLSINPQMMALRGGAHLVVATPGRLLDLTRQNAVRLNELTVVVLDEADRLLDAGFADETHRVLALLPRPRQTLMFSATLPDAVVALAAAYQSHALRLEVATQAATQAAGQAAGQAAPESPEVDPPARADKPGNTAAADEASAPSSGQDETSAPPAITQRAILVDTPRRTPLLRQLIATQGWRRVLVFVATQHASEHVADKLRQAGLSAAALHGDLSQGRRAQVLADLQAGHLQVLVATDLASRGLDVTGLDAVVNHDLPRSPADHTHRIGRTGRAGAAGTAVSFVLADAPGSEAHFRLIEKRQQQRVPRELWPDFVPAAGVPEPLPADPHGGIKGRRKSKKDKLREAAALAAAATPAAPRR